MKFHGSQGEHEIVTDGPRLPPSPDDWDRLRTELALAIGELDRARAACVALTEALAIEACYCDNSGDTDPAKHEKDCDYVYRVRPAANSGADVLLEELNELRKIDQRAKWSDD